MHYTIYVVLIFYYYLTVADCKDRFSFMDIIFVWQRLCVKRWSDSGVSVRVLTQDASTLAGANALLKEAAQDGPIGGIFHLAVVSSGSSVNSTLHP